MEACSTFTNCYGPDQIHLLPDTAPSAAPKQCDTLAFWFSKIGLPAITAGPGATVNVDDIHLGIDDMVMQLPDRSCSAPPTDNDNDKDNNGRRNHSGCGRGRGAELMREVVGIYAQVLPTVFEESYKRHMEEQSRK